MNQIDGRAEVVSLCDASAGIDIFSHRVDGSPKALNDGTMNCTPNIQHENGAITVHYYSGMTGVYGVAAVGKNSQGNVTVGVVVNAKLPSACPGDESFTTSGAIIGTVPFEDTAVQAAMSACSPPAAFP